MTRHTPAITGIGLLTPAGLDWSTTWAAMLAGQSQARTDPAMAGLPVDFSCRIDGFDAAHAIGRDAWRLDRFCQLAIAASRQAVADAGLDPREWDPTRVGVVIGVGSNSMETWRREFRRAFDGKRVSPLALPRSVPNMAAGEVAIALDARGPNLGVTTACSSGATAIATAAMLLETGACDIVITGGAEAPSASDMTNLCFDAMTALSHRTHDPAGASRPFEADRDGFVLGEGAGILVLERHDHAAARRARVRARLMGYGMSADAGHPTAPDPQGCGLQASMRAALKHAGLVPADIHHVNAHGTATLANDRTEAHALRQVFGEPPPVTASKSILGHAIGGAAAIEAAISVLTLEHQMIHPTANLDRQDPEIDLDVVHKIPRPARMTTVLSNAAAFGGQNTTLVIAKA
ncbi:beta-ketoacyl-[acyl-carrier-protein] synthase family protein [Streptomyces sp. NPDC012769]|uniref:beta-ketoacyl-[acyl-carrier-protein] synthase family protein n=1 Tax=Streptomyces sp. NPDC012769 TaxID=3364848 RepID=UPI00368EB1BF